MDDAMLVDWYLTIKEQLICAGYADEIDWQWDRNLAAVTEQQFLTESAWVVINSGFRESTARRLFPHIACAFKRWAEPELIVDDIDSCREHAYQAFRHRGKVDAICTIVIEVHGRGLESFLGPLSDGKIDVLYELPYIGDITALHLAKNLGMEVCKPDRHLQRLADRLGAGSVRELCEQIGEVIGERIDVVDSVLWRYSTLRGHAHDADFWKDTCDVSLGRVSLE